jgi:hypothetical protein
MLMDVASLDAPGRTILAGREVMDGIAQTSDLKGI